MNTANIQQIQDLIARKALFVINHSGGKDSQALLIEMLKIVPREQILVVHASLGRFEWHGALELAQQQAADAGVPFIVARAIHKDGVAATFRTMVDRRHESRPDAPCFPSSEYRQCTSDLKRGPITRETLAYMKANGYSIVVNCEGIRAGESTKRRKLNPFKKLDEKHALAKADREAYEWLPIFDQSDLDVFCTIRSAGQFPHPAYNGNERLSCVFCIMGSDNDILHGSIARPELFAELVSLEQSTGYTMHQSRRSLEQIVAEARAELSQAA